MELRSFAQAIRELAEEKGVPESKVVETIELAIAAAYKKDYGKRGQIIRAAFDPETGSLSFSQVKLAVDESMVKSEEELAAEEAGGPAPAPGRDGAAALAAAPEERPEEAPPGGATEVRKVRFNPERHIMLAEARATKPDAKPGEELSFPLEPKREFGRIASQTAKQVIIQRIREAEREATYQEYKGKEGEIASGIVQRIEGRSVFLDLGRGVGILPAEEQLARERYAVGDRLKALLLLVDRDPRGPGIYLSRSHPRFLKKLFELEVPEIASGVVEIKAMAREAGSRSKVAAASNDLAVDPVGSMVGQRGVRVSTVMNELSGEKIDIIEWAEEPDRFIAHALSPAKVSSVELAPDRREARAIVPEEQLSLAIGRGGQNVRLAAKLTGWRIDVRSASAPAPAEAEAAPDREPRPAPEAQGAEAQAEALPPAGTAVAEGSTEPAEGTGEGLLPAEKELTAALKTAQPEAKPKRRRKTKAAAEAGAADERP